MEVGNRIQLYRKKLGISQEELGKKLFVSRQTVSLWENGQTMPTIENLIHLKEIFGVSIDDLLFSNDDVIQKDTDSFPDVYRFKYTHDEITQIYKFMRRPLVNRCIKFMLITIATIIFIILTSELNDGGGIMFSFFVGVLCAGIIYHYKNIFSYKKFWEKSRMELASQIYEYNIFKDYFTLTVGRENGNYINQNIYFSNIDQIYNYENYFLISSLGKLYILKKNEMKQESLFYIYLDGHSFETVLSFEKRIWKTISMLFNITSWFSPAIGLFMINNTIENPFQLKEKLWLFFVITPIPVLSFIFGVISKKKGYNFRSNLMSGIIFTFILCVLGSSSFIS